MTEIWDLVDKDGNSTGIKWNRCDHNKIPEGLYHPCVEVWVRIGDRVLVTQRHPDKSEGLKYDAPGGAVLSGESIIDGAIRELYEEAGIIASADKLKMLGAVTGRVAYAVTFLLVLDCIPEVHIQPSEVVGYKFVTKAELDAMTDDLCLNCARRYSLYKDMIF